LAVAPLYVTTTVIGTGRREVAEGPSE